MLLIQSYICVQHCWIIHVVWLCCVFIKGEVTGVFLGVNLRSSGGQNPFKCYNYTNVYPVIFPDFTSTSV